MVGQARHAKEDELFGQARQLWWISSMGRLCMLRRMGSKGSLGIGQAMHALEDEH